MFGPLDGLKRASYPISLAIPSDFQLLSFNKREIVADIVHGWYDRTSILRPSFIKLMFWPAYEAIWKIFRRKLVFQYSQGSSNSRKISVHIMGILIGQNRMVYPFKSSSHTGPSPLESNQWYHIIAFPSRFDWTAFYLHILIWDLSNVSGRYARSNQLDL